ncbi:glutamine amidotransferase, partial [Mycobacterium sp. ITM-2017-0098]
SDSAGVAVYGDPTWSPPGRGSVSVADLGTGRSEDSDQVAAAVASALGGEVDGVAVDASYVLSAGVDSEVLLAAVRTAYPDALVAGFGSDMAV